jgi:hypothetical protein
MSGKVYEDFVSWLRRVDESSPPPQNIAAYNIGLFESDGGYTVYLIGSREFDSDDDDWACREDFSPTEKFFRLPESTFNGKDWREVQRAVAGFVKRFVESPESSGSFLAPASAITVGFDDGALERVR